MNTRSLTFLLSLTFLFLFSTSAYGEEPEVKKEYYDNGNLKSETYYKDGISVSVFFSWYKKGQKRYEKINIELHQDVRLVAIVYSTKISKKLNVCRIRLDQDIQRNVGGRVEYELAHKNAVKSLKP